MAMVLFEKVPAWIEGGSKMLRQSKHCGIAKGRLLELGGAIELFYDERVRSIIGE